MPYIRRSFRDEHPHSVPPIYLSAMPPMVWFWEEFGSEMHYVIQVWERQYKRVRLCEAQNWRCCYCGCEVTVEGGQPGNPAFATFEHVQRRCEGGSDDPENLTIACVPCNNFRHTAPAEEYPGFRRASPVRFFPPPMPEPSCLHI